MAESSKPRPLFIYGTLRARPLLAWALTGDATNTELISTLARPAKVRGYARYTRKKLDDFESEIYTPTSVDAVLEDGSVVEADMYVWAGDQDALSDEPWELDTFVKERLEDWLDLFEGMEMIG
ncbi:hypothetical protein FPHYL_1234 [Fusarium phyllophilum]|uniref:Gamma-glutamylcyclotransferase AIG2-like domain-containing protein n=1 Tax=Fusarium phyllophilum TaxID=47803 RepID=A0A8H5NMR4_9HYPO|nr:hypothetical protein FPHYL_1234 [Fusarium phyllophilum]